VVYLLGSSLEYGVGVKKYEKEILKNGTYLGEVRENQE